MNKWTINNFSECIDPVRIDRSRQVKAATYLTAGKYPIVDQGQSDITGWTDDVSTVISENLPYIIFGDHTRIFKYVDFPFALGADGTKLIKPRSDINPRYFYYYLLLLDIPSKGYSRHYQLLKEKDISLPPFPEQEKIAAVLLKLQNAILIQEKIIQSLRDLKKSTMNFIFSRGLHGEKTKYTPIGEIPESWEVVKIGEVFNVQLGKMLSQKAHIGNNPKLYLRNKNVQWGKIDVEDILKMDFTPKEMEKFSLVPGDLLICEGGEPGRAAIWQGQIRDCYYQKALHRLRPKTKIISNEFLVYWLMFSIEMQKLYGNAGASSTIAHLPATQLKSLSIPCPERMEQDKIVKMMDITSNKLEFNDSKKSALQDLFKTILNKLMTGEIRVGELDIDVESVKI